MKFWPRVLIALAFLLGLDGCAQPLAPRCTPPVPLRDSTTGKIIATVQFCR